MIKAEFLDSIRKLIGACPWLTDEEIEATWECIDKQIPVKTNGWNNDCGNCACNLDGSIDLPAYCPNCGQKIDWEV